MPDSKGLSRFNARDRREWREWLMLNHATSPGVWLVIHKKGYDKPHLSYEDAVEEALDFGWIDSRPNKLESEQFLLLLSPRKSKSAWAISNKKRVEKLIKQGLMTPAGLEKIEAAKRDGSWERLDRIDKLLIPVDLQEALSDNNAASRNFQAFSDSVKKIILFWIDSARQPSTRKKRIKETTALAAKNIRVKP